jgi:recombinational DNA repair protein (RecF pathway)
MHEYVTDAVVLAKEPAGEYDVRVSLYTRDLGKVVAKVTSARKIVSKLSPHLEPLSLTNVRLVKKGGFQLVDAIRHGALPRAQLAAASLINRVVLEGEPDARLWELAACGSASIQELLRVLGFGVESASCDRCGGEPHAFLFDDAAYLCGNCLLGSVPRGEYLRLSS